MYKKDNDNMIYGNTNNNNNRVYSDSLGPAIYMRTWPLIHIMVLLDICKKPKNNKYIMSHTIQYKSRKIKNNQTAV